MYIDKDNTSGQRLIKVFWAIIVRPNYYTKKQLAQKFNVHEDTIKNDFEDIRNAGFSLDYDKKYCYFIENDSQYEYLKDLLFFSEAEQQYLREMLNAQKGDEKMHKRLQSKLVYLYEMSRLGNSLITKPFLSKVNLLESANKAQKQVILKGYHSSNSSSVADKQVEPFHIAIEDDILHAFDIEKKEIRHYRISRIEKVIATENSWQHSGLHYVKATDDFRIVEDKQEYVHLRLKVGGYNELIERFPRTKSRLSLDPNDENIYEFRAKVNYKFMGLANFILGHHAQIEDIVAPESLRSFLKEELSKINF
jgi:predicted DNA-binding transcriptional regulator YafY